MSRFIINNKQFDGTLEELIKLLQSLKKDYGNMQEYPRSTNSIEVGNVLVIENEYSEDDNTI